MIRIRSTTIVFYLVTALATGSLCPVGGAVAQEPVAAIDVTYIGNEGFLIEAAGKKILVDALSRWGATGDAVISYETRQLMEGAKPPFDDVDLVLATHSHPDHFDAGAVALHLKNNPRALFVSTPQSEELMKEDVKNYDVIKDRVRVEYPDIRDRIEIEHAGIKVELVRLHHGRGRPIQNLGFIIHIGGQRLFHIGDTEAVAIDFRLAGITEEAFDITFIPYWYLSLVRRRDAVRQGIKTSRIIAMHLPPKDMKNSYLDQFGGWPTATKEIVAQFPNAVIFTDELEKKTFPPGD